MKKSKLILAFWIMAGLAAAAPAVGAEPPSTDAPLSSGPSAESKALEAFFSTGGTWTGKIPAGARGTDSPETPTQGKAVCRAIDGGFWYLCEMQEVIGTDNASTIWMGHMLVGFDPVQNTYRATMVDNWGTMTLFEGELEERSFVLETIEPVLIMGRMMRQRLTWEKRDDGTLLFTDERRTGEDQRWSKFESGEFRPFGHEREKSGESGAK